MRTKQSYETRFYICGHAYGLATLRPTDPSEVRTARDSASYYPLYERRHHRDTQVDSVTVDTFDMAFDSVRPFFDAWILAFRSGRAHLLPGYSRVAYGLHKDQGEGWAFDDVRVFPYGPRWGHPVAMSTFAGKREGLWGLYEIRWGEIRTEAVRGYHAIRPVNARLWLVEYAPMRYGYVSARGVEYFKRGG